MTNTTLHLFKQNFKFSSAHFLIFDEKRAEKLHGHNYQVAVALRSAPEGSAHQGGVPDAELPERGYLVDFNVLKKFIRTELNQWNEMVLLPKQHQDMKISEKGASLEVHFRERFYVFPKNEVVLLPVTNTSVEQLSRILAESFFKEFKKYGLSHVRVRVEETSGQGASTLVSTGA